MTIQHTKSKQIFLTTTATTKQTIEVSEVQYLDPQRAEDVIAQFKQLINNNPSLLKNENIPFRHDLHQIIRQVEYDTENAQDVIKGIKQIK